MEAAAAGRIALGEKLAVGRRALTFFLWRPCGFGLNELLGRIPEHNEAKTQRNGILR